MERGAYLMSEPKPLASLSAGLLARKGAARPAMRRQGLVHPGLEGHAPHGFGHDDLGWNDMGYDTDPAHGEAPQDHGHSVYHGPLAGAVMPHVEDVPSLNPDGTGEIEPELEAKQESVEQETPEIPEVVRQRAELSDRLRAAEAAEDGKEDDFNVADPEPVRSVLATKPVRVAAPQSVEPEIAEPVETDEVKPSEPELDEPESPVADASEAVATEPETVEDAAPAAARHVKEQRPSVPERAVRQAVKSAGNGRRAAFTLRVDPERHLRLRLACAVSGQSAQQLVTQALDDLLTKLPEIEDLADRVPRRMDG